MSLRQLSRLGVCDSIAGGVDGGSESESEPESPAVLLSRPTGFASLNRRDEASSSESEADAEGLEDVERVENCVPAKKRVKTNFGSSDAKGSTKSSREDLGSRPAVLDESLVDGKKLDFWSAVKYIAGDASGGSSPGEGIISSTAVSRCWLISKLLSISGIAVFQLSRSIGATPTDVKPVLLRRRDDLSDGGSQGFFFETPGSEVGEFERLSKSLFEVVNSHMMEMLLDFVRSQSFFAPTHYQLAKVYNSGGGGVARNHELSWRHLLVCLYLYQFGFPQSEFLNPIFGEPKANDSRKDPTIKDSTVKDKNVHLNNLLTVRSRFEISVDNTAGLFFISAFSAFTVSLFNRGFASSALEASKFLTLVDGKQYVTGAVLMLSVLGSLLECGPRRKASDERVTASDERVTERGSSNVEPVDQHPGGSFASYPDLFELPMYKFATRSNRRDLLGFPSVLLTLVCQAETEVHGARILASFVHFHRDSWDVLIDKLGLIGGSFGEFASAPCCCKDLSMDGVSSVDEALVGLCPFVLPGILAKSNLVAYLDTLGHFGCLGNEKSPIETLRATCSYLISQSTKRQHGTKTQPALEPLSFGRCGISRLPTSCMGSRVPDSLYSTYYSNQQVLLCLTKGQDYAFSFRAIEDMTELFFKGKGFAKKYTLESFESGHSLRRERSNENTKGTKNQSSSKTSLMVNYKSVVSRELCRVVNRSSSWWYLFVLTLIPNVKVGQASSQGDGAVVNSLPSFLTFIYKLVFGIV